MKLLIFEQLDDDRDRSCASQERQVVCNGKKGVASGFLDEMTFKLLITGKVITDPQILMEA